MKKILRFIYFLPRRISEAFIHYSEKCVLSLSHSHLFLKIILLQLLIHTEKKQKTIGSLWSKANLMSTISSGIGAYFNLNHLGNVYDQNYKSLSISKKIEKKVIEWNKELIHCSDNSIEGYLTSGGTEANLFLMWCGRDFFKKRSVKPIVIKTPFTHYSISKSARILDLHSTTIKIDSKTYGMDVKNLKKYFLKEFKNKNYSFILPITIGYSSTGSNDPINQILNLITTLKKTVSKFECFCWVDAAAQGIPKSFLDENFSPLEDELIQGYIVDFHKFGTTPLPSGVVLYRKELRSIIETSISYLDENDNTILGSRPGSAALALWGAIVAKSIPSWKKHFLKLENKKNSLISVIKKKSPNVTIINTQHSLTMAIEINRFFPDMSKEIENRYSFVRCKIGSFEHYKVHIQN